MSEAPPYDNKSDFNFWENQKSMTTFVKIIEKYPEIYSTNLLDRSRFDTDKAWRNVFLSVIQELNLECSIDELKAKWKGIRSTFGRYLGKCHECIQENTEPPKKYYLTDALNFLIPHLKVTAKLKKYQKNVKVEVGHEENEDQATSSHYADTSWREPTIEKNIKEEVYSEDDTSFTATSTEVEPPPKKIKTYCKNDSIEDEDLTFFKCILPDIADFTKQERTKFRVGLFKLIGDIESERSNNVRVNKKTKNC